MKKIILLVLFASATLLATDSASVYKSGFLLAPQGEVIYKKQCAGCHGDNGKKTKFRGSARNIVYAQIAGLEAAKLKKELREYRGGIADRDYIQVNKTGYGAVMRSATLDLSWTELDAVAEYVSSLK